MRGLKKIVKRVVTLVLVLQFFVAPVVAIGSASILGAGSSCFRAWEPNFGDTFEVNEKVVHGGRVFQVIQTFTFWGDPAWAPGGAAHSLWQLLGYVEDFCECQGNDDDVVIDEDCDYDYDYDCDEAYLDDDSDENGNGDDELVNDDVTDDASNDIDENENHDVDYDNVTGDDDDDETDGQNSHNEDENTVRDDDLTIEDGNDNGDGTPTLTRENEEQSEALIVTEYSDEELQQDDAEGADDNENMYDLMLEDNRVEEQLILNPVLVTPIEDDGDFWQEWIPETTTFSDIVAPIANVLPNSPSISLVNPAVADVFEITGTMIAHLILVVSAVGTVTFVIRKDA